VQALLEQTSENGRRRDTHGQIGFNDFRPNQALGELRGTFGVLLAQLVVMYKVDG
jgi:hypothetical protein